MKVVAFSDIHSQHRKLILPDGDLLACAGDFSNKGRLEESIDFINWFAEQSKRYRFGGVFIAGNHDFLAESDPALFRSLVDAHANIRYLDNETVMIDGKIIFGSPQTPWFHSWAFNVHRGEEIRRYWEKIPDVCDLLITHGPPMHVLDKTDFGIHAGCKDLWDVLMKKQVKHHMFGHIHEAHGQDKIYGTHCYNVSVLDLQYRLTNPPTVLEI